MAIVNFESIGSVTTSIIILGIVTAVVWYIAAPKNDIYDAFPRISDNRVRALVWPSHVQDLVLDGYQKITKPTGKPFTVRWWARDFLILPPKYLSSLRDAEWGHLSFFRTISDAFFLHTSVGDLYDSDSSVQVVTKGLNPRMPQLTEILEKEIEYALNAELSGKPASHNAQQFFSAIVHRSAARIMIGEELCRNERFVKTSIDFIMSIFFTGLIIVKLPLGPFRDWLAYPLAVWHRRKLRQCTRMLLPVVQKRLEERRNHGVSQHRLDAIEWSLMLAPEDGNVDVSRLLDELMHNLWAGASAPGGLVTDVIFQLLLEPQYKESLVQEALEALENEGKWTEKTFSRLPLLDSFIREINRLYPTGSITSSRTVLERPFVFPDGLTLPVGTRFGFPTRAMQNDAELNFDGFRFAKTQGMSENEEGTATSGLATTMHTTNLAWGYGTHVCPGRFFAVRLVKMVVVTLLLNYDIKWDGNVERRPSPTLIEGQNLPNLSQRVKITKRQTV